MSGPEIPDLPDRGLYRKTEPGFVFPPITLDMEGDTLYVEQDLTSTVHEMMRELRERGDEEIRQRLIEAGIVVVKPGRTPLAWVIGEMGACEVGYRETWCQAHGGHLPSNRKPPNDVCDEVLDIVDKIERYIS